MDYITDVASHIQYNFDENTKNKIKSYSQQHMAKINELFNEEDYELAMFYMKQLKDFAKVMKRNQEIQQQFDHILFTLSDKLKKQL